MTPHPLDAALRRLLALPRGRQREALDGLLTEVEPPAAREAWNTRFGPGTLFEAWTRTTVATRIYEANAAVLRPHLDARRPWRVVEAGGGDGELWHRTLRDDDEGVLVLVDPAAEVHERVRSRLPAGVRLESILAPVQEAELPQADAFVCSLTLHHVAGADAAERADHGLAGPGKREALEAAGRALAARDGLGLLDEADVYCDVGLSPGDPILAERILDSYVRRCARSILDDLATRPDADDDLRDRWRAVLHRWCLEQIAVAEVPLAERDVYELDVPRWLAVLDAAGLEVVSRRFTDEYALFCQYVFRPRSAPRSGAHRPGTP